MNKFTKIGAALVMGMSVFALASCTSTDIASNEVVDALVDANIITLPSINLDFINNERIEITDKLLNDWKAKVPSKTDVIDGLKSRINTGVKHYITQKIPTDTSDYFPISIDELGTLYVVAESLYNN